MEAQQSAVIAMEVFGSQTNNNETYSLLCSAARSRCRRFLNQFETLIAEHEKLSAFVRFNEASVVTCVVVRPVASASSRFSLGDGYGLCVYQSRKTDLDFSLKQ